MSFKPSVKDVDGYFDDYYIKEFVAEGGQKFVYRAEDSNGQDVVVKLLQVSSRSNKRRAKRAVEAMEMIETPVLVNLIDSFQMSEGNFDGFVMVEEYIDGPELSEKINRSENSEELGVKVLGSVLTALKEFDKHSIVHRDIKPSNIMIENGERVRLLDVGIARFTEEDSITPSFMPRGPGTPPYSAPEQLANDKDDQDIRTDLFSLGITGFQTITGVHPFNIEDYEEIPDAIQEGARMDLSDVLQNTSNPEAWTSFFDSLMSVERYERFRKPEFALEEMKNAGFI